MFYYYGAMRGGDYDAVDRLLMVERIVRNLTPP